MKTVRGDFFDIKQPDVVFDSESNGCNFSSLTPLSGENWKKRPRLLWRHFVKKLKIFFFSLPGGVRELKLRPFDSESKTTTGCSNSLISKKSPLTVCFHSTTTILLSWMHYFKFRYDPYLMDSKLFNSAGPWSVVIDYTLDKVEYFLLWNIFYSDEAWWRRLSHSHIELLLVIPPIQTATKL